MPKTSNKSTRRNAFPQVRSARTLRNRRRRQRQRMNSQETGSMRVPRGVLAGYGSAITSSFYTSHTGDGCVVRGLDLVTSPLTVGVGDHISYFITANPAAWNGTRIAAIAAGFQNYRPIRFLIHYRPQVGSTSTLSLFVGTLWQDNYIRNPSAVEPSLVTSPGGTYLPAWQSSTSRVPLGNNLPMRMFPIRDPAFETVPFSVIVRSASGGPVSSAVEMPGRVFIEYEYQFRNAIGSGSGFQPSTVTNVIIEASALYSGATSLGYFWVLSENDVNLEEASNGGWCCDSRTTTGGEDGLDTFSKFPIGCHITFDTLVASSQANGVPAARRLVQVNGSRVVATYGETGIAGGVTLKIYTDNGDPD